MKKNKGKIDKLLRIIIWLLLIAIGYYYEFFWLYLISLILLLTRIFENYSIYYFFKINLCDKK